MCGGNGVELNLRRSCEYTATSKARYLATKIRLEGRRMERALTNREIISICILFDKPQARMPTAAKKTANSLALLLPITSLKRP